MIEFEEATRNVVGYEPQETTNSQRSVNFSFSLQIVTSEGLAIKGDASMHKTVVPQRASKPVTVDIEQEYDDTVSTTPRSALRFRSTTQPQEPTQPRTTDVLPRTSNRVSGNTRLLLWLLLVLGIAFLINGLVMPLVHDALTQIKYGDSRIATYDLNGRHWITEENNGRVRIVVSHLDGSHNQVLTTVVANAPKHALVSLSEDGNKVDVSINDVLVTTLQSDNHGGYQWSAS